MNVSNTLVLAVEAIMRNKVRSLLTVLGVVIGVASVIAMVQLGQGATASVTAQITDMGPNLLLVMPGVERRGITAVRGEAEPFELADAEAIAARLPGVRVAPAAIVRASVVYGSGNYSTTITGTTNAYFGVRNWSLARGRMFEPRELDSGAGVCVIGQTIVDELYPDPAQALGSILRVDRVPCLVVGLLASKGQSLGMNQDDVVLMPVRTVQRRLLGDDQLALIYVSAASAGETREVQAEIIELLRERRRTRASEETDFHVRDMQELADALASTTDTLTVLLGAIAAVSLLVGGIGIMNIMLVSVTERTREIGVRLAVGARAREVLMQFLVESVVLSIIGGLLGIVLGLVGTLALTRALALPTVISGKIIVIAFAVAAMIGVVFGIVPARRAARLNPIDALRHE